MLATSTHAKMFNEMCVLVYVFKLFKELHVPFFQYIYMYIIVTRFLAEVCMHKSLIKFLFITCALWGLFSSKIRVDLEAFY